MTDIILINPPLYYHNTRPGVLDVSYPPLGILYIAAVLEKNGISVKLVDVGAARQELRDTLSLIREEKPAMVGISSMTPSLQGAVTLARAIKESFGRRPTIALGGPHVSADPQFIERVRYFDCALTGEGEDLFVSLAARILKGERVQGVYNGHPADDLDKIPWPARHLVAMSDYLARASLIATRGCPYNCYYCSRPAVSNKVRCRSPEDIVDEMESMYEDCRGEYLFQDDCLTIKRDHTIALCDEMRRRARRFRWAGYTRVDLVDGALLEKMAAAGCYSLTFGIESGCEKLRREVIGKRFSNQETKDAIRLCVRYGIDADGFFMFGHPTETQEQVEETIDFVLENDFSIIGVAIATPFPGSKLWDWAVRAGIVDYQFIDAYALGRKGEGYAGVYPVYRPESLGIDWLYRKRKEIMRRFYLRPRYIARRLLRDLRSLTALRRDFAEGINVLVRGSSARAPYRKKYSNE
ncbi:MAG: radical SAM protein [Candidatus Aureabacteria bacterium]|nr:radical SAM protein [Candidatus Auribacterota bacterium]